MSAPNMLRVNSTPSVPVQQYSSQIPQQEVKKEFEKTYTFKIFWSNDWSRCMDFSVLKYEKDWVLKGWRLKIEWTDNGWQSKSIIFLQDQEIIDLLSCLLGYRRDEVKCQRPSKTFTAQHQGNQVFFSISQWATNDQKAAKGSARVRTYEAVKLISMCLFIIRADYKRELNIDISDQSVLNTLKLVTDSFSGESTYQSSQTKKTTSVNTDYNTQNYNQPIITETQPLQFANQWGVHCSRCNKSMDPVKDAKVIEFSTKKFGAPVCFSCQKK